MFSHVEIERLRKNGLEACLPRERWDFSLNLGEDPNETWQRILNVVENIVAQEASSWPGDEYWRRILPVWLLSFLMTPEECDAAMARTPRTQWGQLPWEFGSWLDAIRDREWRWWGAERSGSLVHVVLEITGIPPRIDAFKQILLAAGAQILSEK